ncbi:MAG: ATP synthase F1 subunit delta [Streptobacillus sp.]|jgi:ATP synthase F1, delta subunit
MDSINVSKRYALAIYDFATENDEVFEVFEVLNLLLEHIKNDEDFKKFLKYPVIDKEEKKKLINHIYSDVNKQSLKILDYLVDKDRLLHIKEIYEEYSKIYYEKHKKLIVTAIFPKELTEAQKEKLTENLKKLKGKDVVIHYRIDEKLIGGGLIRINDEVIDGSIKTQLNSIKR